MRRYLVAAGVVIFLSDVLGGVAYLQKWQVSSLWVFASRLVVPFAIGFMAVRRGSSVGQAGRLGGVVAAVAIWLPIALFIVAIVYRIRRRPTPWAGTLAVAMVVWVVVAALLGSVGGLVGGLLGRPGKSNVPTTT